MRSWLVKKRKKLEKSQHEVAVENGISRSYYSDIENGRRTPSGKTAKKLAEYFGVDMELFFEEVGRKSSQSSKTA